MTFLSLKYEMHFKVKVSRSQSYKKDQINSPSKSNVTGWLFSLLFTLGEASSFPRSTPGALSLHPIEITTASAGIVSMLTSPFHVISKCKQFSHPSRTYKTANISPVYARRYVRSHVLVSTHMQNPQHKRKIACVNITLNCTIVHAR